MADKTIADLTAATSIGLTDLFEIENVGGLGRKVTASTVRELMEYGEWTDLTIPGSTSSNFGRTSYLASETFTLAVGDRIVVEAELEKASGSTISVGVGVGSNAYYFSAQGNDDRNYLYSYNGTATALLLSAVSAVYDYGGIYVIRFVINVTGASENRLVAFHNDERLPGTTSTQHSGFTMAGTASVFLEGTVKRARARVLS